MLLDAKNSFFTLDGVGTPKVVDTENAYLSQGRPMKCFVIQDGAADITITDCDTSGGSYTLVLTITAAPTYIEFYLPMSTRRYVLVSAPAEDAENQGGIIIDSQTNS